MRDSSRLVVKKDGISLAGELSLLRQALAAASQLLEPTALGEDLSPGAGCEVLAVVSLAEARVELLRRALVGAIDPALLRARHNESLGTEGALDDPDIILPAWRGPEGRRRHG